MLKVLPSAAIASLLLLAAACAEEEPGVPPPVGRLHYPMGLEEAGDKLLIVNSNFDQLYNSGSIMTLSIEAIAAAVPADSADPAIILELPGTIGAQRVHSFGGEAVFVPAEGGGENGRLYVAHRAFDKIGLVRLENGALVCSNGTADPEPGTGCTPGHYISTAQGDPFSIALIERDGEQLIAAGQILSSGDGFPAITLIPTSAFDTRLDEEARGVRTASLSDTHYSVAELGLPSAIGLAYTGSSAPDGGTLIAVSGDSNSTFIPVPVIQFDLQTTAESGYTLERISEESLAFETTASGTRGVVVDSTGTRIYVSVRFPERATQNNGPIVYNSAIAVLANEAEGVQLRSILEVGEELGKPSLLERDAGGKRQRLLYIPDVRNDLIWIVDVSTDAPLLAGRIESRFTRDVNDPAQRFEILRAPFDIEFFDREIGGRRLAAVSNFGNSTLAVLDVTSLDPRRHRVVARIGRARTRDGVGDAP